MPVSDVAAAVATARAGGNLDVGHLTVTECWEVARQLGWTKTYSRAYLSEWAGGGEPSEPSGGGLDYEGLILVRQEEEGA